MPATSLGDAKHIPATALAPRPMRQFAMALALYLLWCGVAWLNVVTGQVTIEPTVALILLSGVAATNALFFGVARSQASEALASAVVAAAQGVLGLVWAGLFTLFATGDSHLGLGMFSCAILYALFQVPQRTFLLLAGAASAGYAAITLVRHLLGWSDWQPEALNLVTYLGLMAWLMLFSGFLDSLRRHLQDRNIELRQHIQRVVRIAERDHLTKSYNRHAIMDSLAREKGRADRSNAPVSVCILDLDHFKTLNDEHGHLIGDRVLKQFAKRARAELRAMDGIQPVAHRRSLGRFGGEEFIAILPGTTLAGAATCAERIRAAVADQPFDQLYRVTVSVGVAEYRRGETVPEWLARADHALYDAKANGRDRVVLSGGTPEKQDAEVRELRPARR
jgi:diguanylate cyclase (GGDEF)-like protein